MPNDPQWMWAPYRPAGDRPWTLALAGHLLRRAAFGGTTAELQKALADGPRATVERLVAPPAATAAAAARFDRQHDEYERLSIDAEAGGVDGLRSWWLRRMLLSPHPLAERITLFWHGYFAASNARVQNAVAMCDHVRLLRRHGLGQLSALFVAVGRDPAALASAGAEENPGARPHQALAEVLLRRWSLGDEATEADVAAAARGLKGRAVHNRRFREPAAADARETDLLGGRARSGDDVLKLVSEHPATARRVVAGLYAWLVSEVEPPSTADLQPLVEQLVRTGDVAAVVRRILSSNAFFSPLAYRRRIKSPVELALSILRPLQQSVPTEPLGRDLAALGQNLGDPPVLQGWEGGRTWINRFSVLARANFVASLAAPAGPYAGKLRPAEANLPSGETVAALVELFFQNDLEPAAWKPLATDGADAPSRALIALASLPEFQLC